MSWRCVSRNISLYCSNLGKSNKPFRREQEKLPKSGLLLGTVYDFSCTCFKRNYITKSTSAERQSYQHHEENSISPRGSVYL
ncbi:hypothetical protein Mapa_017191 [Marchantia paleacea]|nr:hypothetical protein Mapa_017191 [Marchantia paleacea]